MTSMTSPSDTLRLRSRLSVADLGFSDTAELDRSLFVDPLVTITRLDRRQGIDDGLDRLEIIDDLGFAGELELADGLDVIERPGLDRSDPSDRFDHIDHLDSGDLLTDLHPAAFERPSLATRTAVRLFDLTVAIVGLIVLAPVMAMVAIAVMIDSPGPLVYGSTRVGHNRPTFQAWKFRSMYADAETNLDVILANDREARLEYETYHKLHNDPRLTRVGAIIRQTSLDELPQLINILLGQMSVVGPRPKLLKDAAAYGETLSSVLTVKPGLTGLWQVSGRNRLPMSERVILDLDYVANRTIVGDLLICVRTFIQLWRPGKHGAC